VRIIVCGSRTFTNQTCVDTILHGIWIRILTDDAFQHETPLAENPTLTIVEGQCPQGGADKLAEQWAASMASSGIAHDPFPADWDRHGRAAGPIRNQAMVDAGADLWVGFLDKPLKKSTGTRDCHERAVGAQIPAWLIRA
jgi:hypothetical protein